MREQAGITLADLAEKSGYSIGTINGLELKGDGSQRLKDRLIQILTPLANKESVTGGRSESATSGFALRENAPQSEVEIWKRRAKDAEEKLHNLRTMLRAAIELSSPSALAGPAADVLERLVQQAAAEPKPEEKSTPSPRS